MRNFHANQNRASGLRYEHAGTSLPHLPRLLSAAAACKCKMDFLKIISVQFLTAWSVRLHNRCDCVSQNRKRQLWRATTAWPDITGTEASHYFCLQSIPIILIIRRSDEENGAPVTTENYDYSSKHTVALWRDCWGFKHSVNENSSFLNRVHWATCQLRVFLGTGISWTQLQCEMCGCRVLCKPDRIPGSTTHFHFTVGCNHTYRWFYSSKQLTETKLELCVLCPPTVRT